MTTAAFPSSKPGAGRPSSTRWPCTSASSPTSASRSRKRCASSSTSSAATSSSRRAERAPRAATSRPKRRLPSVRARCRASANRCERSQATSSRPPFCRARRPCFAKRPIMRRSSSIFPASQRPLLKRLRASGARTASPSSTASLQPCPTASTSSAVPTSRPARKSSGPSAPRALSA